MKKIFWFIWLSLSLSACLKNKDHIPVHVSEPYPFQIPQGFSSPFVNTENPLTLASVELGRHLFYEKRLSNNNNVSCNNCHQQSFAFSDTNRLSRGTNGQLGMRQSMPLQNLAWSNRFFWDLRAKGLEEQIHFPIVDPTEMATDFSAISNKLKQDRNYEILFYNAYGNYDMDSAQVVNSIANFLRTLVSSNSKYDKVKRGEAVFTPQESLGYLLFNQEGDINNTGVGVGADCFHCHNEGAGLFTIADPSNNGLDAFFTDLGVGGVTGNASQRGLFKVPSLRNIELTPPYMHDGRFNTLEEVIAHYNSGGHFSETISPFMKYTSNGLSLSSEQQQALVAFLKTLTDPEFISNKNFTNPH